MQSSKKLIKQTSDAFTSLDEIGIDWSHANVHNIR